MKRQWLILIALLICSCDQESRTGVPPVSTQQIATPEPKASAARTDHIVSPRLRDIEAVMALAPALPPPPTNQQRFFFVTATNALTESLPSNVIITTTNPFPIHLAWNYDPADRAKVDGFIVRYGIVGIGRTNLVPLGNVLEAFIPPKFTNTSPTTIVISWTGNGARIYSCGGSPWNWTLLTNAPGTNIAIPLDQSGMFFDSPDKRLTIQLR